VFSHRAVMVTFKPRLNLINIVNGNRLIDVLLVMRHLTLRSDCGRVPVKNGNITKSPVVGLALPIKCPVFRQAQSGKEVMTKNKIPQKGKS
jgi:hypothetical protein